MKNETKHTPTPWHRNVSPAAKYPIYADRNGDPDGKDWIHIAAVLHGNPNAEADLDFIIKAVNAYDELISLAHDYRNLLRELPPEKCTEKLLDKVTEAIAKAEGRGE
jgi:hypothetical protein